MHCVGDAKECEEEHEQFHQQIKKFPVRQRSAHMLIRSGLRSRPAMSHHNVLRSGHRLVLSLQA